MTQTRFGASFTGLTRQMLAALLPFGAAFCLMLFGGIGLRLFAASLVILPVVLLLAFAISRMDQLAFDHEHNRWLRPLRAPLPADSITSVHLVESLGLIQATARTHQGSAETLLVGMPASRRTHLICAIENSSRTTEVHTRRVSPAKPAVVLAAVLGLPFAFALVYFHLTRAGVAEACTAKDWPSDYLKTTVHQLGSIRFSLPSDFQLTERRPGQMHFRTANGTTLLIHPGDRPQPGGSAGALFLKIAGLRSEYDVFRYVCCTRFAILPLMLKSVILADARAAKLTEHRHARNNALVIETGAAIRILTASPPLHISSSALSDIDRRHILSAIRDRDP